MHDVQRWRWRFGELSKLQDCSQHAVNLQRATRLEVLQHGSLVFAYFLGTVDTLLQAYAEVCAQPLSNSLRFGHHRGGKAACERVLTDVL